MPAHPERPGKGDKFIAAIIITIIASVSASLTLPQTKRRERERIQANTRFAIIDHGPFALQQTTFQILARLGNCPFMVNVH